MRIPFFVFWWLIVLQNLQYCSTGFSFLSSVLESSWAAGAAINTETETLANPCCSFPCQNRGVCMTTGVGSFVCDCERTGYYGEYCEKPTFWQRAATYFKPNPEGTHLLLTEEKYKWIWTFVNWVPFIHDYIMKKIYILRGSVVDSPPTYNSDYEYITYEAYSNRSYFARVLPPVPRDCPTPLGVAGQKELPDVDLIVEKIMKRTTFKPEPMGSNALFPFFAQHFTHQFFKTDFKRGPGFQWGGHGVDVSHIYGKDKHSENLLRSFTDGKLRMQVISGETWPLLTKDADVPMSYPPNVPEQLRFALGHKDFGLLSGLFMYATIWMREHNRICDIMKEEHPEWDDERLFQTSKLIILGETLRIVIEDYVHHLSNYHYKLTFNPELLFDVPHQYSNRITAEFNHMYHWHPLFPEEFNISGTVYSVSDFLFRPDIVIKHGMKGFVDGLVHTRAGAFTHRNHNKYTLPVAKQTILHGRKLRYQPFNQYRKRFGLKPYRSFEELTGGDEELTQDLSELYNGDIDSLEFYVGIVAEKTRPNAIFGSTVIELGGPFSVKGLMSAPICSPQYWKSSTFGGDVGFNIVKTATLENLFCLNMDNCENISFKIPEFVEHESSGETLRIVIEDYVHHLSNYHYKLTFNPELLFDVPHQYSNRITAEFNHMYHWHPLFPEEFNISGTVYSVSDFLFRPDIVIKHGMKGFVDGLVHTRAGAFTHRNHNKYTLPVAKQTILHGRKLRYQPFNQYRKRFGLKPYRSFEELTGGDEELTQDLSELYNGDIDSLEFYVGIVAEKTRPNAIFGSTVIELGGPFSVKGLMSAPICSPQYWKSSTFGGDVGFNIVKTATLENLFCLNMDNCENISFKIPEFVEHESSGKAEL